MEKATNDDRGIGTIGDDRSWPISPMTPMPISTESPMKVAPAPKTTSLRQNGISSTGTAFASSVPRLSGRQLSYKSSTNETVYLLNAVGLARTS
jgi:hypothetical protein